MRIPQHKNRSVNVHKFTMIPSADVPRSSFDVQTTHKTAFNSGYLTPIYEDEILPGDSFNLRMTAFVRLATPIVPVMDNLHLETFFFFIPKRLLWTNFVRQQGERDPDPDSSISYTTPQQVSPVGGYAIGSLQDYFGLPTVGQVDPAETVSHAAYWLRGYNKVFNDWFRDENLQDSVPLDTDDGPDATPSTRYILRRRGKRKDYITGALPWPQKGATAVSLPLGTTAPVIRNDTTPDIRFSKIVGSQDFTARVINAQTGVDATTVAGSTGNLQFGTIANGALTGLLADLTDASAATINQIRQAFQTQRLLERDARGGTRYTEIVLSHFKVRSPDARLQRSEYLGGGSTPIIISPIPQTSGTGIGTETTPLGNLAATGAGLARGHGFTQAFTEHGIIIGLAAVRADLTYQQGMRRMWSRLTRYDDYLPVFSHLGEQAILNKEIYCDGTANDDAVWGYNEAWSDYRYHPNKITGLMRSTAAQTIDIWHLAQHFATLPTLNDTFIQDTPPLQRVLAVGEDAAGQELLGDFFFNIRKARPMPMFSVPGMIDHF